MKTINKKLLLLMLCLAMGIGQAVAQKATITNLKKARLSNLGTIREGNQIKGYYFYYESAKEDKKMRIYDVIVYDSDLNELAKESVEETKKAVLIEASYNGERIMFKFYDTKEDIVIYRSYNLEGGDAERSTRPATKQEQYAYRLAATSTNQESASLNNVSSESFVDVAALKDKKVKYKAYGLDNAGEITWEYTPKVVKGYIVGAYIGSNENQVLILSSEQPNRTSRDFSFSIIAVDNANGGQVFDLDMQTPKYNLMPFNAYYNEAGNIVIMGQYYNAKDKSAKAESEGVFVKEVDSKGNDVNEKFLNWNRDIVKLLPANQKKEISAYSLYFHDVEVDKDGKIYAITEQYRKQVSALGAAMALTGNSGNTGFLEIKVGNIIVVTLDKDYTLSNVEVFEKSPNLINLSKDYQYANQHVLAKMVYSNGGFDYSYSQVNDERTLIEIGYIDSEKSGKSILDRELRLNVLSYNAGEKEPVHDKISLKSKNSVWILPAKPGHILIAEYFWRGKVKDQKIELRIEPINN